MRFSVATGFSEGANAEPCQPGSAGGPCSLAATLRLQPGLPFVDADRLAGAGGLLHLNGVAPILFAVTAAVVTEPPTRRSVIVRRLWGETPRRHPQRRAE